jgi:hypothetical protein
VTIPPSAADLLRVLVIVLAILALEALDVLIHSRKVRKP